MCGERPTDDEMRKLGKLLSLCAKKPWGKAIYVSEGNWLWETKGKITAASINSELVIVFSEDDVAYVYSTKSGAYTIPLFGRKINESEDVTLQLTAGEIATFALK